MDSYQTLREATWDDAPTAEVEDRKSRFISYLASVHSPEEAHNFLQHMKALHYDARHHVFAYVLVDGTERQSDDGEPSRTSGMPTLNALNAANLKDVMCVTVRYFGGTLLGPGGLIRAYTQAAQGVIEKAQAQGLIVRMTKIVPYSVRISYAQFEPVQRMAQDAGGHVSARFSDVVELEILFEDTNDRVHMFQTALGEYLKQQDPLTVGAAYFGCFPPLT